MFLLDDTLVYSASDLTAAATCEFALLRTLDEKLGRVPPRPVVADAMAQHAAQLGDVHERRVLQAFADRAGVAGVHEVPAADVTDPASLRARHDETIAALRAGTGVVFQGSFFDGRFHGRADFLVRESDAPLTYAVYDSKLARHAKIQALLQLSAYADQLVAAGVPVSPEVHLVLGDGTTTSHRLDELLPVYRARRARLQHLLDEHRAAQGPADWNDQRYLACGRCEACQAEVEASRDVLLVAGLRRTQRVKLRAAGIASIDQLAATSGPVEGLSARALGGLRAQAALQLRQPPGTTHIAHEVFSPDGLATLPSPDAGDIFFDFEGDPLWSGSDPGDWGLEYLFGVAEAPVAPGAPPRYVSWWADDRGAEKQALADFLAYVEQRRAAHPGMHIYHFAPYEKVALLRLAGRYGVGEDEVDTLLRDGVLVDLYTVVRQSVRVSQRSYGLKKLEPLYMGDHLRESDVTSGGESVVAYDTYARLRADGQAEPAAALRQEILDYNEYDCLSTLGLRDWLLARADEHGVPRHAPTPALPIPVPVGGADPAEFEADAVRQKLLAFGGDETVPDRSADERAAALVAAALGYHRREVKPFWWAHFDRLAHPVDAWADRRDVLIVESAEVLTDWHTPPGKRRPRRRLRLVGRLGRGSTIEPGSAMYGLYDPPLPPGLEPPEGCHRAASRSAEVMAVGLDHTGHDVVEVEELLVADVVPYPHTPMALAPTPPPATTNIEAALRSVAHDVAAALPVLPERSGIDLLRRVPPRLRGTAPLPPVGSGPTAHLDAITAAVLGLDASYLAVQGPPGTGKTHIGARVIARLVREHGWRIGVVAQSHAVVENLLAHVVEAGVDAQVVGKKSGPSGGSWTTVPDSQYASFLAGPAGLGGVIGGTAWDFTHPERVAPGLLDLLVVDEAGQFSLANTLAVSVAAQRLLLLGDPQQLPQVSQGIHPEPVHQSALGWLMEGHDTLPAELGYFLERTWRMHPALCDPVSRLAYDHRLRSEESVTTARSLDGIAPGIHLVELDHHGNSVESAEEAAEVVRQVHHLLGRAWHDPFHDDPSHDHAPRPLDETDVLVVAPYNAQVVAIRRGLAAAGLSRVRVGTVDRFQGQQAAVVIVSMTASAAADVPRGMSFLMSRHRLNVAVSRGQWCAVVVSSRTLTDHLPSSPSGLAELGAFMALTSPPAG